MTTGQPETPGSAAPSAPTELTPPTDTLRSARLREVGSLFLRLGFTSFGGPAAHIAMMRREVVQRRGWCDDRRFLDLVGTVNLIPGPSSTQLAIYLGYLRAGWLGLLLAGVCFIGPAMAIMLALAWAYVQFGGVPQVAWLLYGIKPVVIAIVAQALYGLGRSMLRGSLPVLFALGAVGVYILGASALAVVFGGGALYGLMRVLTRGRGGDTHTPVTPAPVATAKDAHDSRRAPAFPPLALGGKALLATGAAGGGAVGVAGSIAASVSLLTLFLTFLKLGTVLYGSGYVLLAFLRTDLVHSLGWLTDQQLLDAVSIGQFTPGPVFTTATFIGYLVAGWPGALLATLGIFLPSFALVWVIHRVASALRRSPLAAAFLDGVNIMALALMAGVTAQLGQDALVTPLTWGLALAALAVLLRFKVNASWVIAGGALVGVVARSVGVA